MSKVPSVSTQVPLHWHFTLTPCLQNLEKIDFHQVEQEKLFEQAQTFLQTGEAESAKAVCDDALDRHPEDANFLCLSARVLVKLKRFDEANARIEHALSIYPEFAIPHEVRGDLLLAQGQPDAAAEAFQRHWNSIPSSNEYV